METKTTTRNSALSMQGESLSSRDDTRQKPRNVDDQPRAYNGQWIEAGANVQWRSAEQFWYGTIKEIRNGKAYVIVKHADGSTSMTTLDPNTLKVTPSKANLDKKVKPKPEKAFFDDNKSKEQLRNEREANREGYLPDRKKDEDSKAFSNQEEQSYTMVESDKSNRPVTSITASGDFKVVRVARDKQSAIIKSGDDYNAVAIRTAENLHPELSEFSALIASGSWRKVLPDEQEEISQKILTASGDIIIEGEAEKASYRVPNAVKEEITKALEFSTNVPEEDLKIATTLANNESVTLAEVEWIDSFFSSYEVPQKLRGGYKGQKWASKIVNPAPSSDEDDKVDFSLNFDEDSFAYFAVGSEEFSTEVDGLIAVDYDTNSVYSWNKTEFAKMPNVEYTDIERPQIIPIDAGSASTFAQWLNTDQSGTFNIQDADPNERNLFAMAEPEMDYEELDRITSIVAGGAGTNLVAPERSISAQRQRRGPGGKFRDGEVSKPGKSLGSAFSKARVEEGLAIEADPANRIKDWAVKAKPITAAVEAETQTEEQPQDSILYFAIVDEVDKTAVLNVVAITKDDAGTTHAWMRAEGRWVDAPQLLADLESSTPPPVVELDVPEPAKSILTQIDTHDAGTAEDEAALVASGFALAGGEYLIVTAEDIIDAIQQFSQNDTPEAKRHIRKRALTLNRMDLIPQEWRELSTVERGEELASQSPLYGTYGEVIVAAGTPGIADTPSDFASVARLKKYWKYGPGAAKINWANPEGNLTRCHRHLAKYLGSEDAWAYCAQMHIELFGESNRERDN